MKNGSKHYKTGGSFNFEKPVIKITVTEKMVKTSASDNHSVDVTLTRHQRLRNQQEKCWCFKRIEKDSMRYEFERGNEMLFNDINKMLGTNRIAAMIIASKFDALEHAIKLLPINCLQLKKARERIILIQNDGRFESLFSCIQFKPISPSWYRYRWMHGLLTPFIRYLWWSGCVWVLWLLHGSSTMRTATILMMRPASCAVMCPRCPYKTHINNH